MTYDQIAYTHLTIIIPAFLIGTMLMLMRKGSPLHKVLGRTYLVLMLATGCITLLMSAKVGPTFLGHFGFIHLISLYTLYLVPSAYLAARRGNISTHKFSMIGLYVGGILIAGTFAFMPGRMLHGFLFQ
jgi:uncharacterized membrane protein